MNTVAPTTSQATIQGKFVPGKLEKIRLTNQPVELEKIWLTLSSSEAACSCAKAGALISASPAAARAAENALRFICFIPVFMIASRHDGAGHRRGLHERPRDRAENPRTKGRLPVTSDDDLHGVVLLGDAA